MAKRPALKFLPKFDGAIKGWTINYIRRNIWRVDKLTDFEDLVQDAYCFFLVVVQKYPEVVTPQHFMSLFKTCIINHFKNLSNRQRFDNNILDISQIRLADIPNPTLNDVMDYTNEGEACVGDLAVRLNEAPEEVKLFFLSMSDENFLRSMREKYRRIPQPKGFWPRESTNTKFCRALGVDPEKVNLTGMLREFLQP